MFSILLRGRAVVLACALAFARIAAHANDIDADAPSLDQLEAAAYVEVHTSGIEEVIPGEYDGDVRDLQEATYTLPRYWHMWNEFEEPVRLKPAPPAGSVDAAPEIPQALAPMPAPTKNFAGLGFSDNVTGGTAGAGWPPDVNGDVGPTVYIQAVNSAFGIYDKSSGSRLAAFTEDSLWNSAGTGTPCHGNNEGDPVVVHDGLVDRWILTDFAFAFDGSGNPVGPFYQCIAVSKTSDPVAGGWFFYAVRMDSGAAGAPPVGTLNDYPKFGVWTDCLYMGANGFNSSTGAYAGAIIATFNRSTLYAGQALTTTNSSIGFLAGSSAPFSMFPANLLGTAAASQPPATTPEYFVAQSGSVFAWEVRKYTSGANTCGSGGTLSAATNVSQAAYQYPSDSSFASEIVAQKSTANKLDSLGDRIMQKVQYRKIGSAESLWVVHTTCGAGSSTCTTTTTTTKPQWTQINVTNKVISTTPVQQQIYAPDTITYRWMGSLAVDGQGNMALGYSTSSSTLFPSIAYSGRLAGDTLNQLPQTETVMQAGAGSQVNAQSAANGTVQRWGDYSAMSVDLADDCTFWYTNEYFDTAANGTNGNWKTRIGSFKFSTCVSQAIASKLAFTQQPNASYASGAPITVKVSVEDASGNVVTSNTSAITLALSGGTAAATLSGTKTVNAVAGVATFTNLSVDKAGSAYVLNATDGTLTAAASSAFNITAGTASSIAFTSQPGVNSNNAAKQALPVTVHVQDAAGNPIAGQSITLSIGANPGGSTLAVTTNPVVTGSNGDAMFNSVSLDKVGSGYTLKATDTTSPLTATSNAFNIVAGIATSIVFTTQPVSNSNITVGANIPLIAHVADAGGNAVANQSIALAVVNNPGGATLSVSVNPIATNVFGDANFPGVSLDKVGAGYTLKVTDNSVASLSVTGNAFNIVAGTPAQLAFVQQPGNGVAGVALSPAVTVQVRDALGNLVINDAHSVTLSIAAGPGPFDPGATVTAAFVGGVATFDNLLFDFAGTGYQLGASDAADALTATPSSTFTIAAGVPRLIFTIEPGDFTRGNALGTIGVTEDDGSGNVVPDSASMVDFSIAACGGTVDLGSSQLSNGVATLSSTQRFYTAASGLVINAGTGVLNGSSRKFSVAAGDLLFADGFDGCRL